MRMGLFVIVVLLCPHTLARAGHQPAVVNSDEGWTNTNTSGFSYQMRDGYEFTSEVYEPASEGKTQKIAPKRSGSLC